MNSRTLASFMAGVVVTSHACRPAPTVEAQRAAWQAVRPVAYAFWYQRGCFCPGDGAWIQVVVRGDSVIGVALVSARGAARGVDYALRLKQPTLDGLFVELLRAHAKAAQVHVHFDPRWHFPTQIAVDPIPVAEDDEWQVHIQHFRPLAPTHVVGSPSNSRMQLAERAPPAVRLARPRSDPTLAANRLFRSAPGHIRLARSAADAQSRYTAPGTPLASYIRRTYIS